MFEFSKDSRVVVRFHDPLTSKNALSTVMTLNGLVRGDGSTDHALKIANEVSAMMKPFPALNNNATWDDSKVKSYYSGIAKQIDEEEARTFHVTQYDPGAVDWWIDSGLMASFVGKYKGGNCDDLASYALATCIANAGGYVIAFAQLQDISHSFVLIQSKADALWVLDSWVRDDRVIDYKESLWSKYDKKGQLILHIAEVLEPTGADMTRLWYDWLKANTKRTGKVRGDSGSPRLGQLGKYFHPSAKDASSSGL